MKILGIVGAKGAGKNTAGSFFVSNHGFTNLSFADSLKDAIAAIFCWPREMLEGDTDESRAWREQVDAWWADKLGIPHFTPRFMMQNFGTEIMRRHFHEDIWILNIERKIWALGEGAKVVLTDTRFPNEIEIIRRCGGKILHVQREDFPPWYRVAIDANNGCQESVHKMKQVYRIHESEWRWIAESYDGTIDNRGSKESVERQVDEYAHVLL